MKIRKLRLFRVTSGGPEIPKDMLRYDLAFVRAAEPTERMVACGLERTHVHVPDGIVVMPEFAKGLGGSWTERRWASMGIVLEETADHELAEDVLSRSRAWVTWRRPRDRYAVPDYTALVPVTLEQFRTARSAEEL